MTLHLRHSEKPIEVDGFRISIHGNVFLLKQVADGLHIIEVTDDCIMVRPQTANSMVIVTRDERKKKQHKND